MHAHAKCMYDMHSKRPDSEDKRWRLQYAEEVLPGKFPGLQWFLDIKPPEVKLMHDHTTGLCKVIF